MTIKPLIKSLSAIAGIGMVSIAAHAATTELTVYSAVEAEDLKKYAARFNQDHPDIKINWVRDSTGIVTAKLLAEKANPQADVVWGLAATSLMLLKNENMLESYKPKNYDQLSPKFKDTSENPVWTGMDAWMAAICYNTVEAEKLGLPKPTSWQDLTNPVYKGHIVMPNPSSSGTGYLDVSSWLQLFGEDKGWEYMDALHNNIGTYTHSGSKPCKLAASGETAIGISFAFRAAKSKKEGAPLDIVFPTEGLGWDMEATAIIKGTDKLEAAKILADWAASQKANEMYNEGYAVVAMPGIAQPVEYFPANAEALMIENDFAWSAANRDAILTKWQQRYDSKSEPK
ncbi:MULTISPECIES: putative 2-aminoethylphosphonate ABC transporter substrate-binding protein [Marinomonas]|uniref:Putative 2-aminoethylphosphonate ABC transporter substrate-binding protein n=1 Tax=Marinomonas arctica TaxID=383750 RepID=A0A7H1J350_9GAMM|nr:MULTISPECIES: putative 2-aminoethylphosphonate ABC transporter substrate-binding protein [Marinomonas]MCS7485887.1 phosphonate ABC transporter substrate-binding protein [Marinomonas sp. BSi20414]QNT04916.1 putative 2-aminoethylphosphonate ABC transporter substrate-binding protein [Marinomonas arctica]GGN17538.1 putative 2-aminoethylphosphonate ABC transporter substrate-binding protein [Marinomonas arctica]